MTSTPKKKTGPKENESARPIQPAGVRSWLPSPLTVTSAVLYFLAFPPWDIQFLAWFALAPWMFALLGLSRRIADPRERRRRAFVESTWLGALISLGGFHWVAYVLAQFGGVPWPLALLGLFLFSFICQPQFYLMGPLLAEIERPEATSAFVPEKIRPFARALAFVALYTAVDAIFPKLFVDTLGHSFYSDQAFRQLATIGGAPLLTFLAAGASLALARLARALRDRQSLKPEAGWAALLLLSAAAGGIWGRVEAERWKGWLADPSMPHVKLGVIQANIGDFQKLASERGVRGAAEEVMATFFRLSDQALSQEPELDALIWPETAYPSSFRSPDTTRERRRDREISEFVHSRNVPLLFGGYDRQFRTEYNAFFFHLPRPNEDWAGIARGDGDVDVYRKTILLLFGEYIPGLDYLPFVREAFPQIGNFGKGQGPSVHTIPLDRNTAVSKLPFLPVICYEALFSNFGIGGARKGAKAIVNVTNDSWFGAVGEPQLHLALSTFRSIETRLPQVRSTNTGISALILPDGTIARRGSQNVEEVLVMDMPVAPENAEPPSSPLIVRTGAVFEWIALALGIALAFALGVRPQLKAR